MILEESESSQNTSTKFEETVHDPPEAVGIDAPAWTPALVQQFRDETYDVEYSIQSCRRLLKEVGLSYQVPPRSAAEADEDEKEAFHDELKQSGGRWMPPTEHQQSRDGVQVSPLVESQAARRRFCIWNEHIFQRRVCFPFPVVTY